MCRAGEITQTAQSFSFSGKKKAVGSHYTAVWIMQCFWTAHKCWGDHLYVVLLFLTKTNSKTPSCSPPVSFQWVGCILSSQVSSLLLLIYPEAGTQAGQGIGFHRVMLRGCWARSTVLDWEHTELVQVHQGTENTQSVHSPCDFLFQEPGANMSIMGLLVPYPSHLSRDANKDNPEMDVYS